MSGQADTFRLDRERVDGRDCYRFEGVIDEYAVLDEVDTGQPSVLIDLSGVRRINSFGSRDFRRLMRALEGCDLTLVGCSTVMIEQANLIAGFFHKARVESFFVPMLCDECGDTSSLLVEVKRYESDGLPPASCEDCASALEFDDDESYYFTFLQYTHR